MNALLSLPKICVDAFLVLKKCVELCEKNLRKVLIKYTKIAYWIFHVIFISDLTLHLANN
jgi:hypothetical protein